MKRKTFYFILSCLLVIFLFSFAALCNQCGTNDDEKEDELGLEETTETAEPGINEIIDESITLEEEAEEEATDEAAALDSEKEVPTISLAIYEGPIFSAEDDVCYYRIEARVTGNPAPVISFSKDDSMGRWGPTKAQVNLNNPDESYVLTATAENSEGTATASITITWGCILEGVSVVEDITITAENSNSGYISGSSATVVGNNLIYVGDNATNNPVKGYLSFNISALSSLEDVEVLVVELGIGNISSIGQPWAAGDKMDIKVFEYGSSLNYPEDYAVGGTMVKTINTSNTLTELIFSSPELKNELQNAIDAGKTNFQLKLGLNGVSSNAYSDVYRFSPGYSTLDVSY